MWTWPWKRVANISRTSESYFHSRTYWGLCIQLPSSAGGLSPHRCWLLLKRKKKSRWERKDRKHTRYLLSTSVSCPPSHANFFRSQGSGPVLILRVPLSLCFLQQCTYTPVLPEGPGGRELSYSPAGAPGGYPVPSTPENGRRLSSTRTLVKSSSPTSLLFWSPPCL